MATSILRHLSCSDVWDYVALGSAQRFLFFVENASCLCRKLESEADAIGLSLAAQACYNPGSAAEVFQRFDAMEKKHRADRIPAFLRTHPMNEARIKAIQKNLPAATELFNASGCQQTQSAFRYTLLFPLPHLSVQCSNAGLGLSCLPNARLSMLGPEILQQTVDCKRDAGCSTHVVSVAEIRFPSSIC